MTTSIHHRRGPRAVANESRSGIILLIVLGALTFFSILLATYLAFSRHSKATSEAIARRNTQQPEPSQLINDAAMMLIRGTNDGSNPFYGEDLLSDFYGRNDALELSVHRVNNAATLGPILSDSGYVRFPVSADGMTRSALLNNFPNDDLFAGRLITFTRGPLTNQTFRVIRSEFVPANGGTLAHDNLFIDLPAETFNGRLIGSITPLEIRSLFYQDPNILTVVGFPIHVNGSVRNSAGVGFDGDNLVIQTDSTGNASTMPTNITFAQAFGTGRNPNVSVGGGNPAIGFGLPLSLQPNSFSGVLRKDLTPGDFDEAHDAADHHNWFLSHRRADGSVIPSFHRPAVLNYILNEENDWTSATDDKFRDLVVSMQRATFRPLPIAANQLGPGSESINSRFDGGSSSFALRTANQMGTGSTAFLNQFVDSLINGDWDVDNDGDGVPDSVWVDLGLATFVAPDGKLIRPLIAPQIEDLGGRLNINAMSNTGITFDQAGLNTRDATWAKRPTDFAAQYGGGSTPALERVFQGLGYGPADLTIPLVVRNVADIRDTRTFTNAPPFFSGAQRGDYADIFNALFNRRYRYSDQNLAMIETPGLIDRDPGNLLLNGRLRRTQTAFDGFGYPTDTFGRGGYATGRSGQLVVADAGTIVNDGTGTDPIINEAINTPYESDPTGSIAGDQPYTFAEFESLLRQYDFDTAMLPDRLRNQWDRMRAVNGGGENETLAVEKFAEGFARSMTPHSVSSDRPASLIDQQPPLLALIDTLQELAGVTTLTQGQVDAIVPFELRMGNKMDLNRRFGNGIDDTAAGQVGFGVVDEPFETAQETETFVSADGNTPTTGTPVPNAPVNYRGITPDYDLGTTPIVNTYAGTAVTDSGRQLLARHLYVLMMMVTRDFENTGNAAALFPVDMTASEPLNQQETRLYRARRIAQWAVNVVDYTDSDSIMTAFEYDPDPFTIDTGAAPARRGWDVDGNLRTTDPIGVAFSPMGTAITMPPPVVWGVESPELIFSESYATHNLNVRDTDQDAGPGTDKMGMPMDPDSDQVRAPQGSLFLELYCPRPVIAPASDDALQNTKPSLPAELYTINADGVGVLDLDRQAPRTPGGAANGAPVWRIAVTDRHDELSMRDEEDPSVRRDARPDTASFDIFEPDEIDDSRLPTMPSLQYDRFIIFNDFNANISASPDDAFNELGNYLNATNLSTTMNASQRMQANQVFYAPTTLSNLGAINSNANKDLQVGQYLTLAPRTETFMGSRQFNSAYPGISSRNRITAVANEGLRYFAHNDTRLTPNLGPASDYMPALPMVIAAPRPADWTAPPAMNPYLVNSAVGISVSEPLPRGGNYYPVPTARLNGSMDVDMANGEDYPLTDAYIDFSLGSKTALDEPLDVSIGRIPSTAGADPEPITGTVDNYCTAFLQRLADPTLPFDAISNPYRTMDWITVDLTVFTGEDRESAIVTEGTYATRSRQRDGAVRNVTNPVNAAAIANANALFSYETDASPSTAMLSTTDDHFFILDTATGSATVPHIGNSLSVLNNTDVNFNPGYTGFADSIGHTGSPAITTNDRNLPQTAFAMHPWLNRPLATPYELLMVPACSQARLFEEFSIITNTDPAVYPADNTAGRTDLATFRGSFRHLLNFFFSSTDQGETPEMARLFEMVHTRPKFAGEVNLVAPTRLSGTQPIEQFLNELLAPPFNVQYDDTRLATVNLNSVSTFQAWAGLMRGHLNADEYERVSGGNMADQLSYESFLENRRGYMPTPLRRVTDGVGNYNYDANHLNPEYPTEFAGNFRNSITSSIEIPLRAAATAPLQRRGTSVTLLRGDGPVVQTDPTNPGGMISDTAMFVRRSDQLPSAVIEPYRDRFRSPFNRFQTVMRMPNLASDNSQVFMIRMTLGFFEVDAETQSLGNEFGTEFGTAKRYSALFIVDRSIPVCFLPGQDTNVADVILYQSITE